MASDAEQPRASDTPADDALLVLQGFGVAFGARVVLSSIDLRVDARDMVVVLGPAGTGKSTLLRTLAGFNDANPSLRVWGEARYRGEPWGAWRSPALVAQCARLLMSSVLENLMSQLPERASLTKPDQRKLARRLLDTAGLAELGEQLEAPVSELPLWQQRQIAILRVCASNPPLLCVDEPTVGVDEHEAARILDYLRAQSERRAVMVVLHNQNEARRLGGKAILLAGGRVLEAQRTEAFFAHPLSEAGRDYVRSGSCAVPAPDATREELDDNVAPPPPLPAAARDYIPDAFGPRGFLWLKQGQLAGTPKPGVVRELTHDLSALRRVGVDVLLTLTESPLEDAQIAEAGIETCWFPIPDMHAPPIEQAIAICREIDTRLASGQVVAVHCLAGLGRTGTILAAYLIWEGLDALHALETVRRIEPRWVQSDPQVDFLQTFGDVLTQQPAAAGAAHPPDQEIHP